MKKLSALAGAIVIICVFLFICGCASSKPSAGDITTVPGQDESVLIFYRGILHFASPPYTVYVDGVKQFSLKANQSGRLVVPNGVHELVGYAPDYRNTLRPKKISVKSEEVTFEIRAVPMSSDFNIDFFEKKIEKIK
jgi:hypothetical protein